MSVSPDLTAKGEPTY